MPIFNMPTMRRAISASSPPAWVTGQALNTWGVIPSSNKLADINPANDPAVNPNYPAAAPWDVNNTNGGNYQYIVDWSGAVTDPASGRVWWVDPGGHNSWWGNVVIKLELDREEPLYTMVRTPSGSIGKTAITYPEFSGSQLAEYSDGRPRSHHTTNFSFYWPGVGPGLASEIVLCPSGGYEYGRLRPYVVSETTGERTYLGANKFNESGGGWCAACYDPVRNCVWKLPTASAVPFSRWGGPSSDSWTDVGSAPGPSGTGFSGACSLCYIPGHDLILVGNGGDDTGSVLQTIAGGFAVFDPADGSMHYPTFTGAPSGTSAFACGLRAGTCQPQWAESLGAALAWDMSAGSTTQIMRITPPASGDPRTTAWTIDYLTVSGSNAVTPSAAYITGTYGRFFVWDAAGICGVINSINEEGYFFRYG